MRRRNNGLPQFFEDLKNYCPQEVENIKEEDGENAVIYGVPCFKIEKGYPYEGFIFLSDTLSDYIGFSNIYYDTIEKLSVKNIYKITFKSNSNNLIGYKRKSPDEVFFQILIGQKFYDFCMNNKHQLLLVIKGLLSIFKKKEIVYDKSVDGQLVQMVNKYDTNFNKVFDYDEFQNFAKSLGIEPKLLMIDIDVNHDGVISQEEVINYLKIKTNGRDLIKIFNIFASRFKEGTTFNMTPIGLQKFFHEVQEEPISELEAYQLLINNISDIERVIKRKLNKKIQNSYIANNYKINEKEIEKIIENVEKKYKTKKINLELSLREFNNLLNSIPLSVYKFDKFREMVDLDRPLTDYFINSTHNTYITGHQLKGLSDAKMYSLAMLEGYRLVELDCYNGKGDEIIITHGYTLVSDLNLVDILKELKSTAFTYTSTPVILSIENHLDEYHQNIMAKKFKEILVDLYIFPYENKPDHLPTLRELQNKFIIKCGGKRLWMNEDIKKAKIKLASCLRGRQNYKLKKYVFLDRFTDVVDSDEEENKKNKKEETDEDNDAELEKLYQNTRDTSKSNDMKSNFKQIRLIFSKTKNIFSKKDSKEEDKETEIIPSLEEVRGLPGTKFKFSKIQENNYKPWECVTLKCKKFIKYNSNPIKFNEIIKLSQHCILKAYPDSFNSDNYDIIKCWRCGCQAAALNIQALEDDYTLFNNVFFFQNKRCGYVVKPKKLLNKNIQVDYEKPNCSLEMKIISIYNLLKLIETGEDALYEKGKLYMEIYALGSEEDNKIEHIKYELKCGLMFPIIKDNDHSINIPIYEDELGGIMIKFIYEGKMIGRGCIPYCIMKNGYRKIPIFDNDCYICEGVFVLGYFQKTKNE